MRPTRRGYTLIAVVVLAGLLGFAFGARALNAVIISGAIALVAGGVQLYRADPPGLARNRPAPGHVGESRSVEVTIESTVPTRVVDRVSEGLSVTGEPAVSTSGTGELVYDVQLESRGERTVGPARIEATDLFGLFVRDFSHPIQRRVVVYPPVSSVTDRLGTELLGESPERGAFDRIREYFPGDPLRNVHWASSAKHTGRLMVAEYTANRNDIVRIAGVSRGRTAAADRMASAVASIALTFHDAGVPVAVALADGSLPARRSREHREDMLHLLATTDGGELPSEPLETADLVVLATDRSVEVRDAGTTHAFQDLTVEVPG